MSPLSWAVTEGGVTGTTQIDFDEQIGAWPLKVSENAGKLMIQGGTVAVAAPFASGRGEATIGISAEPGQPVVFTGLREFRSLEILDARGARVKSWSVFGDRAIWDRDDANK